MIRWIAALAIVAVTSGCAGRLSEEDEEGVSSKARVDDQGRVVLSAEERRALDLQTARAERGSLTTSVLRFGKVAARPGDDAFVIAPVTARLVHRASSLGAEVDEGEPLVTIEPLVDASSRASLETQRRQLLGQLESARAAARADERELERLTTLADSGLATEAKRARAEATLQARRARVESLRRATAELGRMTGGQLELRAPAAGVVAELASRLGEAMRLRELAIQLRGG